MRAGGDLVPAWCGVRVRVTTSNNDEQQQRFTQNMQSEVHACAASRGRFPPQPLWWRFKLSKIWKYLPQQHVCTAVCTSAAERAEGATIEETTWDAVVPRDNGTRDSTGTSLLCTLPCTATHHLVTRALYTHTPLHERKCFSRSSTFMCCCKCSRICL